MICNTRLRLLHNLIHKYYEILSIKELLFKMKMNLYNDFVIKYKNKYFK